MNGKIKDRYRREERRCRGVPISDGIACGPARLVFRDSRDYVPHFTVDKAAVAAEKARLAQALSQAAKELDRVIAMVEKRLGRAQANIFAAQQMIILDDALRLEAENLIDSQHINAESACAKVLDVFESRLQEFDNDYLKDRSTDIGEVRRRILDVFRGGRAGADAARLQPPADGPCIIVAEELLPGEAVSFNPQNTAGFLTERGGPASHVAILARGMGIPAISGVESLFDCVTSGDQLLLNGTTGEFIVNPTRQSLNLCPNLGRLGALRTHTAPPVPGFPVYANISTAAEVGQALEMDAEGIGLYRTEFEFIQADRVLSESEQYERYAEVMDKMAGKPVYLRLVDLGGDKAARFLNVPQEENPALGFRGARLLLGRPELLAVQARAIARASRHGPIHVVYPMIVDEQQFQRLRALFMSSISGIETGEIRHGVMFEVPSACICAQSLLQAADFGSIGSNDLSQYLFALDRDNGLVAGEYNPDHAAFWSTVKQIAAAAHESDRPLSLCGEIAGRPKYLPKLVAHGIRCVSVSPRLIGLVRITVRQSAALLSPKKKRRT